MSSVKSVSKSETTWDVENVKWHKMYIITFIIISDWLIADAFAHW